MEFQKWLTVALAAITLASAAVVKTPPGKNFELLILHTNDMHARFDQTSQLSEACTAHDREAKKCYGGFSRVAHVVKKARRAHILGEGPPVLFLNAGDTYMGTDWFVINKWVIAAEFINALQPDAICLGNHEFDNGVIGLTPFIENVTCPVLATNVVTNKEPELHKQHNLKRSIVINVKNNKIGIVGYLTPETKISAFKNNVEYIEEIEALKTEVQQLQNQGVKIIVALGHSGYIKDMQIAKEVKGIDLVLGGHSHTFLWNGSSPDVEHPAGPYPTYVTQASGRRVPVVQAYAYTKYLGILHVTFDTMGEIINVEGAPLLLDYRIPQDPDVSKIVEKYRKTVFAFKKTILGSTTSTLTSQTCKISECNTGNLITDAIIYNYATKDKRYNWTESLISVVNGGAIRSLLSVPDEKTPTPITKGDILNIMPFDGDVVAVTLNGTILLKMLEHAVSNYDIFDPPGNFLQISGLTVTYNLKNPLGSRVVGAEIRCRNCNKPVYSKVEDGQIYKVLMSVFLNSGGDGYGMFEDLQTDALNYTIISSIEDYISKHSPICSSIEGRIKFLE